MGVDAPTKELFLGEKCHVTFL